MSQTCPTCGSLNRATNRFCSNCGSALVSASTGAAPGGTGESIGPASSSVTPPGSGDQPVTYVVRTWEAPEPSSSTTSQGISSADSPAPAPAAPPAFVPFGGYPPTTATAQSVNMPAAGTMAPPSTASTTRRTDEGATYAPYAVDVARKLEKQPSQRSWLIPSVVAAAILLLLLVGVAGFLWLNPRAGSSASNSQTVPGGVATTEEGKIQEVIRKSNEEQITAWRNLDTEVLKGTRTGQVLQENIQAVEELRQKDMYAVPENKSIEFGEIKINGDTATAKTVEVWTVTFYRKSDSGVVLATGPDKLSETYHLVRQNGKWLVSSVDIQKDGPPGTPTGNET